MEDGSEDAETKKEEKEEKAKDKKKKGKKGKTKSDSPEPVCIDDEFKDTQISQVEGGKGAGGGAGEAASDLDRGEVATPTHRWADPGPDQLCIYQPLQRHRPGGEPSGPQSSGVPEAAAGDRPAQQQTADGKLMLRTEHALHVTICATNRAMSGHSTRPYGKGQTSRPGGKTDRT